MQGEWRLAWFERDGVKTEVEFADQMTYTIKGNKWLNKGIEIFYLEIDAECDPKILDLTLLVGKNKGHKAEGIYKIDGDTMVWCWYDREGVKERPLEFSAKRGSSRIVLGYSRMKR